MSINTSLTHKLTQKLSYRAMIPLYIAAMLAVYLLAVIPKAGATAPAFTNYAGCVSYVGPIFSRHSVGQIRQNYTGVLINGRLKTLNELLKRTAKLQPSQQAVITAGINTDKQTLIAIANKDKTVTDIHVLRDDYCQAIYKTQVNQFRVRQVIDLQYLSARNNADNRLSIALNNQAAASAGQLQTDINQRLDTAKGLIAGNLSAEASYIPGILNATVDQNTFTNNLPAFTKGTATALTNNFRSAYRSYTEVIVLKTARGGFNPSKTLVLKGINLTNNGNPVSNPSDANKSVVRIQIGNHVYDRTVSRRDSNFRWHVTSTKSVN